MTWNFVFHNSPKSSIEGVMEIFKKVFLFAVVTLFIAGCATQAPHFRLEPSLTSCIRNIDGFQYVPLTKLCDAYGINCNWDSFTKTACLKLGATNVALLGGSRNILVNGNAKKLDRPVVITDGTVFVPVSFVKSTIAPISPPVKAPASMSAPIEEQKAFTIKTIVLDTGHGGKDAGAVGRGRGTKEKDVALQLAKKVKALLEDERIRVMMVRSDDTFIPLPKRADIANASAADLFVSIHINASFSRTTRGFECYYLSDATDDNARALEAFENSSLKLSGDADVQHSTRLDKTLWDMTLTENRKESGELAGLICQSVDENQLVKNNGVKTARFYVLKHTHIPSVLVETGYISNRIEEMKLRDPEFLNKMAEAIVRGILRYKKRYEATEGFTNV